MSALLQWAD